MNDVVEFLNGIHSVLLVDWPSRDVPETLARAGFVVTVRGGPGPEDYSVFEPAGEEVAIRHVGVAPERADLVYAHRPISELPGIVAVANALGARAIWLQSGRSGEGTRDPSGCWLPEEEARQARTMVESAGLAYFDQPYIAEAARRLNQAG